MSILTWSTIADDNGNSDPTINWAEGQMPSTVNNSARAMMAALAAFFADSGGKLVSAGSSNAYTLSTNMGVTALTSPLLLMFEADRNNTGAATLAVDGLAAKPMVNQTGGALSSGDIVDGGVYLAAYNGTADIFVLVNVTAAVAAYLSQAAEVTVASAATANILGAASSFIAISGTTTITSFGTGINRLRFVRATGAFQITHNATSLICPTGASITTAAGDTFIVESDASSNARIFAYQRATGQPLPQIPTAGIVDKAVTYAKIQDASATARIMARKSASSGPYEETSLSELLDFIGSAASGDILYRGASAWARLAKGSDGQILTLASGLPSWAGAASAGKIGQVLQATSASKSALTSTITGTPPTSSQGTQVLSQAITPSSASNTIRVTASLQAQHVAAAGQEVIAALFRGTTCIQARAAGIANLGAASVNIGFEIIDTPATTSPTTYSVRVGPGTSGTVNFNGSVGNSTGFAGSAAISTLTLEEILP